MTTTNIGTDLRHDAARRRAVARRDHERGGEAGHRPPAREARRRRDRGRLRRRRPTATSRRCARVADAVVRADRAQPGAHARSATSSARCAASRRRSARHPHLHRHLRPPSEAQAHDEPPGGGRRRLLGRQLRQAASRLRRVLRRGRLAQRPRLSGAGLRRGDQGRRPHAQRARHHRLRHARGVRRAVPRPASRARRAATASSGARTATTTSAWRWPTRWPRCATARARSSARSTASASAPATPRWKRS